MISVYNDKTVLKEQIRSSQVSVEESPSVLLSTGES